MNFRQPRPRKDEERILLLINIVFLLLIFFMLAGRLAASDPFNVEPLDGDIVDEATLGTLVAERLPKDGATTARIRLKADGGAQAERVVAVMELLRDAGVSKLTLLTTPKAP